MNKMENTENKNSLMKYWPIWLVVIAVAALVLINTRKTIVPAEETEYPLSKSGKVLSMVDPEQFFSAAWFGKKCPDFTVTTIDGKQISLSSFSGKQVMLVCWATWCPPCREEIPHLIELRNTIAADKLEIIGLSFEDARVVKNFAEGKNINYTIAISQPQMLPEPFSKVTALPTMFVIDASGNLKIALEGSISFEQMKGIVEAQ